MAEKIPIAIREDGPVSVDQAQRLLGAIPLGLLVIGRDGAVRLINDRAAVLLGVDSTQVDARHWRDWLEPVEAGIADDPDGTPGGLAQGGESLGRYHVVLPDGGRRVVEISRTERLSQWPQSWAAVLWLRDCTREHAQLQCLQHLSRRDHLTNLVNRREFESRLGNALERARRDGSRHALLFMDLYRFKQINDRFGHRAGDLVLKQVAEVLRSSVRARDTLGRLGGDEFGLLMEQ